jgi:hypothetical protein
LRQALAEFRERYNQRCIVRPLRLLTLAQARQQLLALGPLHEDTQFSVPQVRR